MQEEKKQISNQSARKLLFWQTTWMWLSLGLFIVVMVMSQLNSYFESMKAFNQIESLNAIDFQKIKSVTSSFDGYSNLDIWLMLTTQRSSLWGFLVLAIVVVNCVSTFFSIKLHKLNVPASSGAK